MKADKKFSIKVKSKTERRIMEDPELNMITEWNIKRIIYALIVLILLVILPAYYFNTLDDSDTVKKETSVPIVNESFTEKKDSINATPAKKVSVIKAIPEQTPVPVAKKEVTTEKTGVDKLSVESSRNIDKEITAETVVTENKQQPIPASPEHLNLHITRAMLAQGVNKLEPYGEVELPILVDSSKAQRATYFTEVNNMQGSIVFHEWLKEGKTIYKRKIIIRGNRWRIPTSKLFTSRSIGQWQVRIITQQGDILHKIDFSVEKR